MSDPEVFHLPDVPVHLGLGARAVPQERFDGSLAWYDRYVERTDADGSEGRLVSMATFDAPWVVWEVHPSGDELVVCLTGTITLHQEHPDGTESMAVLHPGDAVVNAPGVWHTADVDERAIALFVTAGVGTEHRPR
ncbi:cupin domain-containing protein [Rhabdothermincola salaria]|uniref:cupin domain-containing protein n=1 Tax=Rhabdothermincola salaria TaxID=2903142 RepID=UPI001E3C6BB1|nr:cupin domain-containing protein [Rhabdothermincola salaria]MCD9624061.1 cupin domain-containing protein [Rhabdothermincola salaria]